MIKIRLGEIDNTHIQMKISLNDLMSITRVFHIDKIDTSIMCNDILCAVGNNMSLIQIENISQDPVFLYVDDDMAKIKPLDMLLEDVLDIICSEIISGLDGINTFIVANNIESRLRKCINNIPTQRYYNG